MSMVPTNEDKAKAAGVAEGMAIGRSDYLKVAPMTDEEKKRAETLAAALVAREKMRDALEEIVVLCQRSMAPSHISIRFAEILQKAREGLRK